MLCYNNGQAASKPYLGGRKKPKLDEHEPFERKGWRSSTSPSNLNPKLVNPKPTEYNPPKHLSALQGFRV